MQSSRLSPVISPRPEKMGLDDIANATAAAAKASAHSEISKLLGSDDLPARREATVACRGAAVFLKVSSVAQEIEHSLRGLLKGRAVETWGLGLLVTRGGLGRQR